jgi:hypothetical protein
MDRPFFFILDYHPERSEGPGSGMEYEILRLRLRITIQKKIYNALAILFLMSLPQVYPEYGSPYHSKVTEISIGALLGAVKRPKIS